MYSLWLYVSHFIRPMIKWFLRKTTGLCELQRICYGQPSGAPCIQAVQRSLDLSRSPQIRQLIIHLNDISDNGRFTGANEREILEGAVRTVMLVKEINPSVHVQFIKTFGKCVEQIWGYRQLFYEVETTRKIKYDSECAEHEKKLLDLWTNLMPCEPLESRISRQWQDIGFQGDDPKTDFRGMGLLGLENLLYFSSEFNGPASHVLSHSHHPDYGYAFAIVGINITHMAWQLMKSGEAKTYFFNMTKSLPSMRHFHQFYCYLFYEFDRFWIECKPKNVMEFSCIKDKFEQNIRASLMDPHGLFKINILIDNI